MICEFCGKEIDGNYGSGRFCDKKCASAFSTKDKRDEISLKVSKALKGRKPAHNSGFKKGGEWVGRKFGPDDRIKAVRICKERREKLYETLSWDDLPKMEKRRRILTAQNGKCLICGLSEWLGKEIGLEIDHINGIHSDDSKDNLRILCPNCHSQTPTYRNRKRL